jgi:hypothetical protein
LTCSPLPCAIDSRRAKACDRLVPDGTGRERRRYDRHYRPARRCLYRCLAPGWQQAFCREVRQLVHAVGSQVTETIMRTNCPCFVLEGCIPPRRGHRPRPRGDHRRRPCQQDRPRTVAIRYGEAVSAPPLVAMFRQIIASDRVGGWRELKRQTDPR